jgi:four helix bundle protein
MFLKLDHYDLDIYGVGRQLLLACYRLTRGFPPEERFVMTQQMRRTALSIHLNTAEGFSRKSLAERKRFFEVARGSANEVDAILDAAFDLGYFEREAAQELGSLLVRVYQMLSKLISNT